MGCTSSQQQPCDVPISTSPASPVRLLGGQASTEFAKKRVRIDIDGQEAEELPQTRRSTARKSTPWVNRGDAPAFEAELDEDEDAECQKHVTIAPAPERQTNADEAQPSTKRSGARKMTPWVRPGDAKPIDVLDYEGDSNDEGVSPRQVAIAQDLAAQNEHIRAQRRVAISAEATRHKEEAEMGRDETEQAEVRRSRQRKSTPYWKPEDARGVLDQADEDLSDESPVKKVVIDEAAVAAHEEMERQREVDEGASEARRTRQRKSTPFCKPGAAMFVINGECEEDEADDQGSALGERRVTICDEEGAPERIERSRLRKGTPWVKPGAAPHLQFDDERRMSVFTMCSFCYTVNEEAESIP